MSINSKKIKSKFIQSAEKEFGLYLDRQNGSRESEENKLRSKAFNEFLDMGLPHRKIESWKYTSINFLNSTEFDFSFEKETSIESLDSLNLWEPENAVKLVFINGYFSERHSDDLMSLAGVSLVNNKTISSERVFNDAFGKLNKAFSSGGASLKIEDNYFSEIPFYLIFVTDAQDINRFSSPANLIEVGKNSSVKFVVSERSKGDNQSFSNAATDIKLGDNAEADFYFLQDDSTGRFLHNLNLKQAANSRSNIVTITTSGKFVRNNFRTELAGEGAEAILSGFYFTDDENLVDNHTEIDHAVAHCHSDELFKGVLSGRSKGVFNGKVLVRKDSQQTNAYQTNRNILLSDSAVINTKPELEIYADDVKCSHGATSGYLNEEELFYLRARGLDPEKAKALLLRAFAGEVLDRIKIVSLREFLQKEVDSKLKI